MLAFTQQRVDTVGARGADHTDTPNLDHLVEEGVSFTDCHITALSCARYLHHLVFPYVRE